MGSDNEVEKSAQKEKERKKLLALAPIAKPIAGKKLSKRTFKLVRLDAENKCLKRGVKEVVKSIRRGGKGLCVIAVNISPVDVITHVPVLCEENDIPYIYVTSKEDLANAGATKRPTCCVLVTTKPNKGEIKQEEQEKLQSNYDQAILVGQVGQNPIVKKLRSGNTVTMLVVGTGGIRNNRRPLDNEDPKEYANRCAVQYHRVVIYPERLGRLVAKNMVPGSILYLEGNLETKVFSDQITGLVRRVREIAIRRNGRLVFLGKTSGDLGASEKDMRRAGYF